MAENMISISVEEYKEFLKMQVVLELLKDYVKSEDYISDTRVREYLGIKKEE